MRSEIIIGVVLVIYFFPAWLAGHRRHHNDTAIFFLNLLLGWTLIGWALALIWATTAVNPALQRPEPQKRAKTNAASHPNYVPLSEAKDPRKQAIENWRARDS